MDVNDVIPVEIQRTASEAIERANIDIQIETAQKYKKHSPNMMSTVKANMMTLATLDEETAASCFYTLPRGGKSIQGESVRLAEIAFTCYGNLRVSANIIETVATGENPHVVIRAVCHDLEQNVACSIEKRRRITKKKTKSEPDDDDIQLATNACTAIAFRDAVFKAIPKSFIRPVMLAAKKVAVGDVKSLAVKRQTVIERLNAMGATTDRILSVCGCAKIEDIGLDGLELLIGLGTALKEGDTTLEEAFPPIDQKKPGVEGLKEKLSGKKPETPPEPAKKPARTEDNGSPATGQASSGPDSELDAFAPPPNGVPDSERYYCNDCDTTFAKPAGTNKNLCPKLHKNIVDRWVTQEK